MSFEESIEKLTERHEALTQTVEIIASMQKENEKWLEQFGRRLEGLTSVVESLVQIVQNHERRLDNLENPGNPSPSQN